MTYFFYFSEAAKKEYEKKWIKITSDYSIIKYTFLVCF